MDPQSADTPRAAPALVSMASVEPQAVRWLWSGRIALGSITIIDGDPGLGKSQVTTDLAARVSSGRDMPDGTASDLQGAQSVIMVFCEDDPAATVRPRLDIAGADVERIFMLEGSERPDKKGVRPFSLADIEILRDALKQTGARLVVVDPWAAYIGGRDSRSDEKMRELLTPLGAVAREYDAAIVIVRHLRKAGGAAATAGAGSVGITGAARSVLMVGADIQDPDARVLAHSKSNLAPLAESLTFRIRSVEVPLPDHKGALVATDVPQLVWGGVTEATADDLVAAARVDTGEKSAAQDAEAWLLDHLEDEPRGAEELKRAAERAGISERTLQRVRSHLHKAARIWKHKEPGACGSWWWGLGSEPPASWLEERAGWNAVSAVKRSAA